MTYVYLSEAADRLADLQWPDADALPGDNGIIARFMAAGRIRAEIARLVDDGKLTFIDPVDRLSRIHREDAFNNDPLVNLDDVQRLISEQEPAPVEQSSPTTEADNKKQAIQKRLERAVIPKGCGSPNSYSRPLISSKEPDWSHWKHMPRVEPWQACCLALNIEPIVGTSLSDESDLKFNKLRELLDANEFERQHFSAGFVSGVRLTEFASWCIHIGYDIPPELVALAKSEPQTTQKNEAEPVKQSAPAPKVEAVTVTTPPPVTQGNKLRRNNLDPAIDKAIKQAGNMELADVYLELKALAIDEAKPFTGVLDGDALCYTNDNNEPAKLTKNALGKRLKKRR